MKLRNLTDGEIDKIKNILKRYTTLEYVKNFPFNNLVVLEDKNNTSIYYGTDEVISNLKNFKNINSIGMSFGIFEKGKFKLTLEGMDLIGKNIVKNYAVVNDKGETLFLYGRDILKSSIIKINGGGIIGIFNKRKEFLGIGSYGGGNVIKNIIDKGWYLRSGW